MRKPIAFATLALVLSLLGACSHFDGPLESPVDANQQITPPAGYQQQVAFVRLPQSHSLKKQVSATALITPKNGGELILNYADGDVSIQVSLTFPPGAVEKNFRMRGTLDDQTLAMDFDPSTVFLREGSLNVDASGLDLSFLPKSSNGINKINLLWYNPASSLWEVMNADRISVSLKSGALTCTNGRIPHFSRYCFGLIIGP